MSAINPLASTSCFDIQSKSDQYLLYPAIYAAKKAIKLAPTLPTAGFTDTIAIRLLLVAQSIVSLIALPFKILVAIFSGINAMINSGDPKSWLNTVYAMGSVGAHALAIPAGIVLSCLSIDNIIKGLASGRAASPEQMQEFLDRQAQSWIEALGIDLEDMEAMRPQTRR